MNEVFHLLPYASYSLKYMVWLPYISYGLRYTGIQKYIKFAVNSMVTSG